MNNRISDGNYIVVFGWMRTKLHLSGSELMLYSILYSFTQGSEEHWFKGSHQFLADWLGVTRRSVINLLNSLLNKNLIIKHERIENGVRFCDYRTLSVEDQIFLSSDGCENIS